MKKILYGLFLVMMACCPAATATAGVDFSRGATFDVGGTPVDVAVSDDGDRVYVLTDAGDIRIYASDGEFEDAIHVGGGLDFLAAGPSDDQILVGSSKSQTLQTLTLERTYDIDVSGAPFQGPSDAPVVIAVFMDYQCPYCVRLGSLLEEVLELNEGLVKIAYKQFPLKSHKAARAAAAAALVAFDAGKFSQLHTPMEEAYKTLDDEAILDMAVSLGFDREDFKEKMAAPAIEARIEKDLSDGKAAGVTGIPTVFVNGRRLKKRSLEQFQEMIVQAFEKLQADD